MEMLSVNLSALYRDGCVLSSRSSPPLCAREGEAGDLRRDLYAERALHPRCPADRGPDRGPARHSRSSRIELPS